MLRLVFAKRYTERSMRSLLIYSLTPNPVICFTLLYKDARLMAMVSVRYLIDSFSLDRFSLII